MGRQGVVFPFQSPSRGARELRLKFSPDYLLGIRHRASRLPSLHLHALHGKIGVHRKLQIPPLVSLAYFGHTRSNSDVIVLLELMHLLCARHRTWHQEDNSE